MALADNLEKLAARIDGRVVLPASPGYIDSELENWEQAYYGANLPRLRRIKAKFDPDNFFRFSRSIAPE